MVSLASLSGCGGPAPQPTTPENPATPKTAKQVASDDQATPGGAAGSRGALDMAPVAEPLIVGMGRWKSPASTMSSLSSCSGVPPQLIEGNSKTLADLILRDALGGAIDTQELASVVAMDAPIDAVVALDSSGKKRDVFAAISIGLTSLERAKGAIESKERGAPPVEIAPGMWRVGDRDNTDASCAIAAAVGGAPARLICGDRDKDLVALGPYLARNAPLVTLPGADMHGEARFRPLIDRFGSDLRQQLKSLPLIMESQLSIGDPKFDRAVSDAAAGLQGEFTSLLGDLDKVSFDIGVEPGACLSASGSIELRGSASWLAGTIADRTERNSAPPAIFWQVPKDSDMAFYGRGADPARFSPILQTLRTLAEGAMGKMNMGGNAADRKALAALLTMPLSKDASSVQASGHLSGPAADPKKPGGDQQMLDSLVRGWLGWTLIGVDQGSDAITKVLKDFVAAYTRQATLAAAFDKAQKKERDAQADLMKRGKQLTIEDIEAREKKLPPRSLLSPLIDEIDADTALLPTIKVVAAPGALGKGAMAIELKIAGIPSISDELGGGRGGGKPGKKATIQFVGHLLLMVDDKTTWIAIGTDKDELIKRLLSVKSDAPVTGKLSSRGALEPLKSGKFLSGGFATLAPMTNAATSAMAAVSGVAAGAGGVPPEVQEMLRVINALPHRGEAPIFFTTQTSGGGAPKAVMSFKVSQAVMEDIGAIVMGGLKIASKMRP